MKSGDCLKNEHGLCRGFMIEESGESSNTAICACQCHDPMYQLVRNSLAVINKSARNNPYQFTSGEEDG